MKQPLKRPEISIFDYEESSDLSRAVCDGEGERAWKHAPHVDWSSFLDKIRSFFTMCYNKVKTHAQIF